MVELEIWSADRFFVPCCTLIVLSRQPYPTIILLEVRPQGDQSCTSENGKTGRGPEVFRWLNRLGCNSTVLQHGATWCNYILSILRVIEIPAVGGAAAHHV